MKEVSCKVFEILLQPLTEKGVTLDQIVVDSGVTVERLRNKKERIDWNQYAAIMRNVRRHFTDEEYIELGRSYMRSPGVRFVFVIARLLFSPIDLYRWFSKPREGVGNQMFTCIRPSHRELSPNEIELRLTIPDEYEMCWDFFLISSGNMEELPRLFGLPRARLKLTRLPRGAQMNIVFTSRIPLLARIWRVLTWPFTARAAARELQEAHETLLERYEELEAARGKLDRQARQLRTAHTVNDLVHRDLDLGRTLETIVKVLVDEAGFAWASIALAAGDVPAREVSAGGAKQEPALHRTLEASGGQVLATLTVAASDTAPAEREELLDFLTPSLAMAVQNAIYREGLERQVARRTIELRQARDELAGTVDQLRAAQTARERFFANISHEIRTPLSIIMLAAGDIETRFGSRLDARARAALGAVTEASRKLVRLVDELLLLAAGQESKLSTHPEPTDVATLCEHLVAAWRPLAEHAGLELAARLPGSLVLDVDPIAMERVATNLVSNAVKYTPRGGSVELELVNEAGGVRLSVLDTGPGIEAQLAQRLFGRFERGEGETRRMQGTGLGLALAKQLVEAHGGTLAALPRETGGAELRVTLPAALVTDLAAGARRSQLDAPIVLPSAVPTQLRPPGISRGTILIAEDDVRLADQIAHQLADDYTVLVAHDGHAAEALVRKHQPQLLVTDVDMPGIDGIELSRRFREITRDQLAPIIVLSAVLDRDTRIAGLEAGAVDYVTKPFDPLELRARIASQFRMRELALRLHRAEQLSLFGVLTAGLAHELRNPANGILNAVHPLRELLPPELVATAHPVGALFGVIADCADHLASLSRQLLGFRDGSDHLEVRRAHLREIVERARLLARGALTGIELRCDLGEVDTIVCAPPLMTQVLTNLIENAGHAAGPGGWISVRARSGGGRLSIEVADSGPGVPPELRDRVFEPFFTTKAPGRGTGLGLAVSRDVIVRHGGVLEIRDQAFVIELPENSAIQHVRPAVSSKVGR